MSIADDLPEGIYHYEDPSRVPAEIRHYWNSRYLIFSKYDRGIWMTDDGWYGVTPESVAEIIAENIAELAPPSKTVLIDAFAGMGGNIIAFAKSGRWEKIFAVEKDPLSLQCAKHNAEVYGVASKICWVEGDCFEVIKQQFGTMGKEAVIFGSPPWGGPGYRSDDVFDLSSMQPYNLKALYESLSPVTKELVLYLPRTSDLNQLARFSVAKKKILVTHYCMKGQAICAYYGEFTMK